MKTNGLYIQSRKFILRMSNCEIDFKGLCYITDLF